MKKIKLSAIALVSMFIVASSFTLADGDPYYWFDASSSTFSGNPKQSADNEIAEYPLLTLSKTGGSGFHDFEYGYNNITGTPEQPVGAVQQIIYEAN